MEKYVFKNIEIVQLDNLIDDSEVTGTLLKAYARIIAPIDDGGGDSFGGSNCDSASTESLCP